MLSFCPEYAAANPSALDRATDYFRTGRYSDALTLFEQVKGSERISGIIGAGRTLVMTGRYAEAEAVCRDALREGTGEPRLVRQLAHILTLTGRSDEALANIKPVADQSNASPGILVQYGKLLQSRGRGDEAASILRRAVTMYDTGQVSASQDLALIGVASQALGRFHDANRLFREALRTDPNNLDAEIQWGDLFRAKYNDAEARRSYTAVLERNPKHVAALVGLAKTSHGSAAQKLLEDALAVNGASEPALEALAEIAIEDGRFDRAQTYLARILEVNRESVNARTLLAAIAYLDDDHGKYSAYEQSVAQFSPGNARFYARIAEVCGRKYRFEDAVELSRKALATDPQDVHAATILGMNLLRLGREEEGRQQLEHAFEKDPFNFWTMNMLEVLDKLTGFETRRTDHFIIRMHPSDAAVLGPYLESLLEESWATLTAKYGVEPQAPILIEVFPNHEDFAVRTAGLPDIGPLVGVCFGAVITLDSPRALKPPRAMNWQEIVWHEFAHVITLHMADNRIPRWLSEGISVYEEKNGRPEWGRRQDLALVKAVQQGRILPVRTLNEGFSKAEAREDLSFAYYQSYLVVEYIVERYGFQRLKELVFQYRKPKDAEDIFMDALNVSLASFEDGFDAWLEDRVRRIDIYVHPETIHPPFSPREDRAAISADPASPESSIPEDAVKTLRSRVASNPRDFEAHFQLGLLLSKNTGDDDAMRHLKIARDLLPEYAGDPNPRQVLADLYRARGDEKAMLQELETLARYQQHAFEACVTLAKDYLRRGNDTKAIYYLERAIAVDPYQPDVHRYLAAAAYRAGDYGKAIRGYRILAALDATDPVRAYTDLAQALLAGGKSTEAKIAALSALEIAPTFKPAQNVLLDSLGSEDTVR
jgi:tetratricopeptide (TPR) repeat protein